jgi:hypothetical protein
MVEWLDVTTKSMEGGLREGIKERMRNEKTHETSVALLAEVTDGGGRFSATRPEEFE